MHSYYQLQQRISFDTVPNITIFLSHFRWNTTTPSPSHPSSALPIQFGIKNIADQKMRVNIQYYWHAHN
jgi:hypothetical protein